LSNRATIAWQGGQAEEEKEADHVGDGCDHDAGGKGGIDAQFSELKTCGGARP
jgi:hypothetical protein